MNEINLYLQETLKNTYSEDIVNDIVTAYSSNRLTTFRINTLKISIDSAVEMLNKLDIKYEKSSLLDYAFILLEGLNNLLDSLLYKEGYIYLQSLSSMIPPLYLDLNCSDTVLDMCAAPGSKTSLIQSITSNETSITAIEKDKYRFERLKHNMSLLGVKNICLLNIDALKIDEFMSFDKILLDAPCSGSGTLSLLDSSMKKFSKELVKNSSILQEKLLTKGLKLLKKGGVLVYSTCSILKEENEEVVNKVLKRYSNCYIEDIKLDCFNELDSSIHGVKTIKPTNTTEGFFICKIRKK